jgi:DNA-binding NarL/FixJ family response regulator
VPARLLVVADPKMLPALAGGLREGGTFEVVAISLADAEAAQAAAVNADAVAVFYGGPGAPLPATLQALAPKVRDRGARVIAVLQREQAAQRDECFRAGASDLLFMPIPKDQFVARLAASVSLAFPAEAGATAAVSVATRSSSSRIDNAKVSPTGVEAAGQLPLKNGDTVRLSWGSFQIWGVVVRAGPSGQIRFAGLAPDEEGRIREWIRSSAKQPAPASQPAAPVRSSPPPRTAPVAGPPPGFSDRKPARPQTRSSSPGADVAVASVPGAPRVPPSVRPAPAPKPTNGNGALSGLVEGDGATPAPTAPRRVAPQPPAPKGPLWPVPAAIAVCRKAVMHLLEGGDVGPAIPANVAASARKITALLSVGERASIENAGPESYFAEALAVRMALEVATAEGTRLASANVAPNVDGEALAALTKLVDEAAARLQKEANAAIGNGQVESLQLVTAASAALSRDLLNLKETADRLRGVGAAPRLGAGALDPDVVLPGQQPRPRPAALQAQPAIKAELRDFRGLEEKRGLAKPIFAVLLLVSSIVLAAYGFHFGVPHQVTLAADSAGPGVQRIDFKGEAALVTITQQWLAAPQANLPRLTQVLRQHHAKKGVLRLQNGTAVGILDVATGKTSGLPAAQP